MYNKKILITGIIIAIVGIGFASLSFLPKNEERLETAESWTRLSTGAGEEVRGEVVDSESETVSEGARRTRRVDTIFCPVYEYTVGGTAHRIAAVANDDCKDTQDDVVMGETATILYDPADPETAFVKTPATEELYKDADAFDAWPLIIGSIITIVGVLVALGSRQLTPEQMAIRDENIRKIQEEVNKK